MTENNANITGNLNTVLQNIRDSIINISLAPTLPEEVKQKKAELKAKAEEILELLKQKIAELKPEEIQQTEETKDFQLIARSLRSGKCILFIGPEISTDKDGVSLHEKFYRQLSDSPTSEAIYNVEDGLFQPHDDPMFELDITEFYQDIFPEQNKIGYEILDKLASINFPLIFSLAPDETIHNIYEKYDIEHEFLYYNGTELKDVIPSVDKPVIFNVLGSAVSEGAKYIFTYSDLYNYIKNAQIPSHIKDTIKSATHFIFIGFDFAKWYNRLLLFILDLHNVERNQYRLLIEKHVDKKNVIDFLQKQFRITIVENEYREFVNNLYAYLKFYGTQKNLSLVRDKIIHFYKRQSQKLNEIARRLIDAETMEQLSNIEKILEEIIYKLKNFTNEK